MNSILWISVILNLGFFYKIKNLYTVNEEPLIITDFLMNNQHETVRELSRVEPFLDDIQSYSGYFRVSEDCVRNMFFWYFPPLNGNISAPIVVWLQGGPGASSMFGLFTELGPYWIDSNHNIHRRDLSWNNEFNLIFFDNPVGTGFSFSEPECFLSNEDQVGLYLSICMEQFYQLFPELSSNELYITGESYAGKFVPSMVYAIDQRNRNSSNPINLQGMAIGNGFYAPYYMLDFGSLLFNQGLIFDNQIEIFDHYREMIQEAYNQQDYQRAFDLYDELFDGELTPYPTIFNNITGLYNYYNFRLDREPPDYYAEFLQQNSHRLNAGNIQFYEGPLVQGRFEIDFMQSVIPTLEYIINAGYRTLMYTGQLDVCCGFFFTSEILRNMNWNGKQEFEVADQIIWYSHQTPRTVNGYVRHAGNLMQIQVRDASHMVPTDQPEAALDMLTNFIYNIHY